MSQADIDNGPEEQTHDLKQQIVTTISIEAELCRSIKSHGDLQVLTDTGPWTQRWFCTCFLLVPVGREAPGVLYIAGRQKHPQSGSSSSSCITP